MGSLHGVAAVKTKKLLKSIERFNTEFHKSMAHTDIGVRMENLVCTGVSVHLLLSMIAVGAEGDTREHILDALHITENDLPNFKNVMSTHLPKISDNADLISLYKICVEKYKLSKAYKKELNKYFDQPELSRLHLVDNQWASVNMINHWFFEKSYNKFNHLVFRMQLSAQTEMILVSAIAFKTRWLHPFERVSDEPFYVDRDTRINVPTMHITGSFLYKDFDTLNAECVVIPCLVTDYNMVIVRPKETEGLARVEKNLEKMQLDFGDKSAGRLRNLESRDLRLSLPKFKIHTHKNLEPCLRRLDMNIMFGKNADFRGIARDTGVPGPVCLEQFAQKAFIEVDEIGGAPQPTSASTTPASSPPSTPCLTPREFKVDRPFIFRVVKKSCNLTLLSGRFVRPSPP